MDNRHCRFCGHELKHTFADLGFSPLANEYLREADLERGQVFYPLKVQVCEHCFWPRPLYTSSLRISLESTNISARIQLAGWPTARLMWT